MIRTGIRRFATTARRAAETAVQMEASNQYGIGVSKAQGVVKGLTGGRSTRNSICSHKLTGYSHWKYTFDPLKSHLGSNRM